jgi:hypothetical protein
MTLKHLKPHEAVAIFTQSIGEFDKYCSIAVVPNASAIVVTQRTSIIRKVITLKNEKDKP